MNDDSLILDGDDRTFGKILPENEAYKAQLSTKSFDVD